MKNRNRIYLILILIISSFLLFQLFNYKYRENIIEKRIETIRTTYHSNNEILVSYTNRINKRENGILEELTEKISSATDPIDIGTYKNALSYYYLLENDYEMHTKLANESIDHYEKSDFGAPLILETYNYMITNSIAKKEYDDALKYSYASMEKLETMDYSLINESFEKNIEISLNCNLINIFVNNNLSSEATKYFEEVNAISEDDPLYEKNIKNIVFVKLIYTDAIGDYDSALKYAIKYHEIAATQNSRNVEGMRVNVATALLKAQKPDEALPHIKASEKHYMTNPNPPALGNVYRSYGEYYLQKGNYQESFSNFISAYDCYKTNSKYITDQIAALENAFKVNLDGNLNNNIQVYLKEYFSLSDPASSGKGIASLFSAMDEINSKSYESKLILKEKEEESLKSKNRFRNIFIIFLLVILLLLILITFVLFKEINTRKKYEKKLQETVNTDFLTKCYSRIYGINLLTTLIKDTIPFTLALLDIDDFKRINDTYGHLLGDEALNLLGNFLTSHLKNIGVPIRYGGEEFIIIFKNMDIKTSFLILDDLREQFSKLTFGEEISCTLSIGAKSWSGEALPELLHETDKLLYEAKNNGKNRVFIKY